MSYAKPTAILIAFVTLALLVVTPGETPDVRAGVGEPPPNDDFADATVIRELPFTDMVDTIGATKEVGEPLPSCVKPEGSFPGGLASTVWYRLEPEEDGVLMADNIGSRSGITMITVYEGEEMSELTQSSCNSFKSSQIGFQVSADQVYHVQLGMLVIGGSGDEVSISEPANVAGTPVPPTMTLNLRRLEVPECPAPRFTVSDTADDVRIWLEPPGPDRQHDILQVGASWTEDAYCIRIEFADEIDPPGTGTKDMLPFTVNFDTDFDSNTGTSNFLCQDVSNGGFETIVGLSGENGVLALIGPVTVMPSAGLGDQFGLALFEDQAVTLITPLSALDSGSSLGFVVRASEVVRGGRDCAPDGGLIRSPIPASLGDVNCDNRVDSRDAALILQMFARLTGTLACQHAGDANGNGTVGSIDAALILQLDAGLINVLPGASQSGSAKLGDVNCNGQANAIDAVLVLQFGAGLLAELPCEDAGDVNQDGVINSIDASLMIQFRTTPLESLPLP